MKFQLGTSLLLLSFPSHSLAQTCNDKAQDCVHTALYQPVCGSNGFTYYNEGVLTCAQECDGNQNLTVESQGKCPKSSSSSAGLMCGDCMYTQQIDYLCGSDGKTYQNTGHLSCENACFEDEDDQIMIVHFGQCRKGEYKPDKPEDQQEDQPALAPVDSPILADSPVGDVGIGIDEPIDCDPSQCVHTEEIDYVCGSNGITYTNPAVLSCANFCIDEDHPDFVTESHKGKCKYVKPPPTGSEGEGVVGIYVCDPSQCLATTDVTPVCGSDGLTYMNVGVLSCQNFCKEDVNDHITLSYHGACKKNVDINDSCHPNDCLNTQLGHMYVCGSNDVTYINSGVLQCANYCEFADKIFIKSTTGRCQLPLRTTSGNDDGEIGIGLPPNEKPPPCDPTECLHTTEYEPVCGDNDVTYSNTGVLSCANYCLESVEDQISVAYPGECTKPILSDDVDKPNCDPNQCISTTEVAPVCGSDGATYDNASLLSCQNYCRPSDQKHITVAYQGACKESDDVSAADMDNDTTCPHSKPPKGTACTLGVDANDCKYSPVTCTLYGIEGLIFGYEQECTCMVAAGSSSPTYHCASVNVDCPDDQKEEDTPAPTPAVEADPNNHESCPLTQPDWNGPRQDCDASVLTTDCLYDKYECEGFEDYAGYITQCSCGKGDNKLYCAQALVQCPDVDAPGSCPNEMPREGESCAFGTGQPCQYNPYSCPDSMDIYFADVCECSVDATFVCSTVETPTTSAESRIEGVHPNCHNDIDDPKCPIVSPSSQNEACSIDSEILCGYDPVGCPGLDDPEPMFLTTCQCQDGAFECFSYQSGLDCDGDGTSDTEGDTPSFDICFPGDALVEVQGHEESFVPMNQLRIGDRVRVDAKGTYEPIYSFGHLHPTREAEFMEFHTTSLKQPLRMTSKHLIYEQRQGLFIPASNVKVGDILVTSSEEEGVTVTSIRKVQASGLYAPFTPSGTIMVNNILVSSFIDLQLPSSSSMTTTMQWLAHMGEFPHRVMCYYSGYNCKGETYNEVGINEIYIQPLKFIQEYLSSSSNNNNVLSTVFMTLIPILFMFFSLAEQFLLMNNTLMMTMGLLIVVGAAWVGSSQSSLTLRMVKTKKHVL